MRPAVPARWPRGSEWRRWDLQIHTPYSALNNGFGTDFDAYAKRLLEEAVELGIAAIGVTDYFSVQGYRELRGLLEDPARLEALLGEQTASAAARILLLPNVELRASVLVQRLDGSTSRVNYHVIFSEDISPTEIEENFLRQLRLTAESNPGNPDEEWALTVDNLEILGRRLKQEHAEFRNMSDVMVGMTNAVVSPESVLKVLTSQASRFSDRYLVVVPSDEDLSAINWTGQGHLTRKVFIQRAHMLFSANPNTREFGLGRRHPTVEAFKAEFKTLKPCIHSSDAHDFNGLFRPDLGRFTWIKADPTFRGLRQLLHEPDTRVHIGTLPDGLRRARGRPTRIADRAQVAKVAGAMQAERWFDVDLPLNNGLCCIIGNKGSGKSALADIIALVGNTKRADAFSFLNSNRFRQVRDGKAEAFEASIRWADGSVDGPVSLNRDPDPTALERIRYIPQNYLEEICNEIGAGRKSRFYAELQQVIFSHVPVPDRLGFTTLDDLLNHLGDGIQRGIKLLRAELGDINRQLSRELARSLADEDRSLAEVLVEKRRELEAHERAKPDPIAQPEEDPAVQEQNRAIERELTAAHEARATVAGALSELRRESESLIRRRATADRLISSLSNLERQSAGWKGQLSGDAESLGLDVNALLSFSINVGPVQAIIDSSNARIAEIARMLDRDVVGSTAAQYGDQGDVIAELEARLTAPQQAYQRYLSELAEWNAERTRIVGDDDAPGSISNLEAQRRDLSQVPARIAELEEARNRKCLEIYAEKQRLREHYETYHRPVQEFLQTHPLAEHGFQLAFETSMREVEFAKRLLAMINQGRIGPFHGIDEGLEAVRGLLGGVDWGDGQSVLDFARSVIDGMRLHDDKEISLTDQLVQGTSLEDLLDYLFGLDYVEPVYELKWDGKGVDELSPGERGNLLLIFYFLIDREEIPLVIDQPEENLDNQTVVRTLVPCVKDAKERRQIIMVTHNPNLAVVCDADQVIYSEIHKDAGNEVIYESGSIENPATNARILDVLEGTRPAFDQRGAKYRTAGSN